jgi:hypothetical protein
MHPENHSAQNFIKSGSKWVSESVTAIMVIHYLIGEISIRFADVEGGAGSKAVGELLGDNPLDVSLWPVIYL